MLSRENEHRSGQLEDLDIMGYAIVDLVKESYTSYEHYNNLHFRACAVRDAEWKHLADPDDDQNLADLDAALALFVTYTVLAFEYAMDGFCQCLKLEPELPIFPQRGRIQKKRESDSGRKELQELLTSLSNRDDYCEGIGISDFMDMIEWLIFHKPQLQAILSRPLAYRIGQLSDIVECLRQIIRCHKASSVEFTENPEKLEKVFNAGVDQWMRDVRLLGYFTILYTEEVIKLGTPKGKKFYHPMHKERTKTNVDKMISAEQNLDKFWQKLDERLSPNGVLQRLSVAILLKNAPSPKRTAAWVEPLQPESYTTGKTEYTEPIAFHKHGESENKFVAPEPKKEKEKTRGVAVPSEEAEPQEEEEVIIPAGPKIEVDFDALKIFKALFHEYGQRNPIREVPWEGFKKAMISIGFRVEDKRGSKHRFIPTVFEGVTAQIHSPHPNLAWSYTQARSKGKQLNDCYGWTGETFVEKEKP